MSRRTSRSRLLTLLCMGTLALGATAHADTLTFNKGALIIPMQSTFQTPCGMISAYGLIYRILQANAPGHRNASHPVTVYLVNNEAKASPNRCQPTNFTNFRSSVPQQTNSAWSDGCDFSILNANEQPVVPVDYSASFPGSGTYPDAPVPTRDDTKAWPRFDWSGITLQTTSATTPAPPARFTKINYLGGPFVIDAPDAQAVIDLLQNGDSGAEAVPKAAIDLFTTPCSCSGLSPSTTTISGGLTISGGCHYVQMHQATQNFSANVSRRINKYPSPFALFETPDTNRGGGGGLGILGHYLQEAGLYLKGTTNGQDSEGCPVGNVSSCTSNGSTSGAPKHGNIYDLFQIADLDYRGGSYPNGIINQKDAHGDLYYRLFWAPHWDVTSDSLGDDHNGVKSLVQFVGNHGNVMTECASITSYENAGFATGSNFLFTNEINFLYSTGGSTPPVLPPSGFPALAYVNRDLSGSNCTDPGWTGECVNYPNPGNIFSLVGDWVYTRKTGNNAGYAPASSSARQPWTKQMVTASDGIDVFDMGQQDTTHGVVIYVGGHDVSQDPVGARVVLNSMLNLGASPIASERDLAGPVIYSKGSTQTPSFVDTLFTSTYDAISGYPTNPAVQSWDMSTNSTASMWVFPYIPGHLRDKPINGIASGLSDYADFTLWDATNLNIDHAIYPKPHDRNLFTYFGGYPKGHPILTGGGTAPHNALQVGWVPENVEGTHLNTLSGSIPNSGCMDVMGVPAIATPADYDDQESSHVHLVRGSDGLCDLQESMNLTHINAGNDWGGSGHASDIAAYLADTPKAQWLLQRVRGYCYSTVSNQPNDTDCVDPTADNRAHVGGLVHSTAAVIGPSDNIPDAHGRRPTVAYVGGYDGQLHAFYVGGGKDYDGPASPPNYAYNNDPHAVSPYAAHDASKVFTTNLDTQFKPGGTLPPPGTELWSYLPASQLPHLPDNSAQVDSSPVVADVFADFSGSGLREWHTVLVASVGRQGNELFAMDITNPLQPRLLWDVVGSLFQTGSNPVYSPTEILSDTPAGSSSLPGNSDTIKWQQPTAQFKLPPAADIGRTMTKVYDYQDLGGSSSLTLAEIRIGLEPFYVVYASTNQPGGRTGIEVFAIDVVTGQKLWQWEQPYAGVLPSANAVPPPPSIIYGPDGASRVVVGDAEGHLWLLNALTGVNVSGAGASAYAFSAGSTTAKPQPITTNVAVAVVPLNMPTGKLFYPYRGQTVLFFGTAGADWLSSPDTDPGKLFALAYNAVTDTVAPVSNFPLVHADGERLYGTISVGGSAVVYATATKSVTDLMTADPTASGKTYEIDLAAATTGAIAAAHSNLANYGGVALYKDPALSGKTTLFGTEISKLDRIDSPDPSTGIGDPSVKPNQSWTFRLRNWVLQFIR